MTESRTSQLSRRQLIRQLMGTSLCLPLASLLSGGTVQGQNKTEKPLGPPGSAPSLTSLSPEDDQCLNDLESADFLYFWEQASPKTGMVKDRCNLRVNDQGIVASIAATGFGLTALCIGHQRGFISTEAALERVFAAFRFLWKKLPHHRGFFYRVDWTWLSEDTSLLPHGWTPEIGFLPSRWDYYSELMMMYLLGLGSSAHPLKQETWSAWKRLTFEYDGMRFIGSFAPLFVHQYSQAWFDFRGRRDKYADYFQNSVIATEVHRRFCVELGKQFPDYSDDLWGITASDSDQGYVIWGGPPAVGPIDGTIVPSAAGGSLTFLPQAALRGLK